MFEGRINPVQMAAADSTNFSNIKLEIESIKGDIGNIDALLAGGTGKSSVQTLTELKAVTTPIDKEYRLVEDNNALWRFDVESTETANGTTVVAADDATTGMWLKFANMTTTDHTQLSNQDGDSNFQHIPLALKEYLVSLTGLIGDPANIADKNFVTTEVNGLETKLASTANGEGASLVGLEDVAENYDGTTVEAVIAELSNLAVDQIEKTVTAAQTDIDLGKEVHDLVTPKVFFNSVLADKASYSVNRTEGSNTLITLTETLPDGTSVMVFA